MFELGLKDFGITLIDHDFPDYKDYPDYWEENTIEPKSSNQVNPKNQGADRCYAGAEWIDCVSAAVD